MAADRVLPSLTGARTIGQYFTVVSFLPSTVFVSYVILLAKSGAWSGQRVDFAAAVGDLSLKDAAILGVASMLLALALHPLQWALVQIYEGYWGDSALATRIAALSATRHRRRSDKLESAALELAPVVQDDSGGRPATGRQTAAGQVRELITAAESMRLFDGYPAELGHVMPTRLGNVLRRYELLAGRMFGIDAIAYVPRVLQLADPRDVEYVRNQRIQLELALRTTTVGLAASALTVCFMWRHGIWMLLALGPYAVAYGTYRGAVSVAREYGTALAVLLELNRFALYRRLRLPLPADLGAERELNGRLAEVLRLDNHEIERRFFAARLAYRHPAERRDRRSAKTSADGGPAGTS